MTSWTMWVGQVVRVYMPGRSLTGSRSFRTRMEEAEYSVMRFENGANGEVDRGHQWLALPGPGGGADCTACAGIPSVSIIARMARIWTPSRVW